MTHEHPQYFDGLITEEEKIECLGAGKYCNMAENNTSASSLSILEENIIQKCVYIKTIDSPIKYIDFMIIFFENCFKTSNFSKECNEPIMKKLDIDVDSINNCFEASFIFPRNLH